MRGLTALDEIKLPNIALGTSYPKIIYAIGNWKSPILFLLIHSNVHLNNKKRSILYSSEHLNEE